MTLNWLIGDGCDPELAMDWNVLSALLLGNEAAPLKKALIDAKLGADVFFSGTWGSAYEQEFHVGIKGSEPDRADAFQKLVVQTLEKLAAEPFAAERIEAACQQLAYHTLEVNSLFPLHVLEAVNSAWPYNAEPLVFLRARQHLEACHARTLADPQRLNRMLRDGLLRNPHRLRVVLRPDREAQARTDAAFAERMAARRAELSPTGIAAIAESATALAAAQGVPNSPEALAKLPQLKTADLPAKPRHIPTEVGQIAGTTVLRNDVFANGVNYLEVSVDLAGLPPELYPWLPRFCEVFNKMGTVGESFARVAERRAACTGGLWCGTQVVRPVAGPAVPLRRLRFSLKTLDNRADCALGLLGDLLFGADPRDRDRLRDVLAQTRAWLRTSLVNDGAGTARRQAARGLSPEAALEHLFVSPGALRAVEALNASFDSRADEAMLSIERIRDFLAVGTPWTVSFTGSDSVFRSLTRTLAQWGPCRRGEAPEDEVPQFQPFSEPPREGLAGPMQVAHCAMVMPAPYLMHPDVPLFRLGLYLANFDTLLPEIRFKGNAYGAGGGHDDGLGALALYSFRDPHIVETLAVFAGLRETVAAQTWSQTDIDRAIIGSAKEAEKPIRPAEATGSALTRYLRGDTNELREQRYAALLRATPETVREAFLDTFNAHAAEAAVCVVSSREKLEEANRALGDRALAISDILS
jgi:Zn-dependent M16 (insulinase) family peptidase